MKTEIIFTHLWVAGFGWENTVYIESDFDTVELLGQSDIDGHVFIGINGNAKHILKGYYKTD